MLTIRQLAISLWLLSLSTSFVMSVPMSHSHVLRVVPDELPREKREVTTDVPTNVAKNDTKPNISSFTVTSNIKYRYATTTVSNKVANPADVAKEISFTVTLPDAAFISRFLMIIKDKVYEAYVKEKEQAKKEYQEAVDRGDTAGHVELSARDSNVFTVSVNVEPQSKVTFNLTYEQLLTRTLGLYENIINVNPGQIVKSMQIQVNIDESSNITVLQVPDLKTSNEIDSVDTKNKLANIEQSGKTAKITWTPTADQQKELSDSGVKGQFIVRYDVDRVTNPNQILVDEGYFVHFYAPADLKTLSKHVLFALDISGSMGGRKIEQLREALSQILGDIGEGDYFTLVLFSDSVQLWTLNGTVGEASPSWNYDEIRTTPQPDVGISEKFIIPASKENIAKAKAFASTLNETGGTNIIAAIRKSIQIAQWGQEKEIVKNAKPLIIFLTDGQPNVEMSDTEEIIKTVKKLNVNKYPLFSLAFGQGADYDFLRKLSLSNSGFARNIYVASDTHLQLNNFYKQVASPLLSNVNFEYLPGQIANETLTKAVFNNLFNGSELVVAGKLVDSTKSLVGNVTAQSSEGFFCVALPPILIDDHPNPQNRTKGHLEKLWAYLHIKELLDKDLLSDEKNSTYKQKALKLSLEYSFVTPLTSLVVVKPNETTSAGVHNPQNPESASYLSPGVGLRGPGSLYASMPASALGAPGTNVRKTSYISHRIVPLTISGSNSLDSYDSSGSFQIGALPPLPHPVFSIPPIPSTTTSDSLTTVTTTLVSTTIPDVKIDSATLLNITDIPWLKNVTDIKFPSSNNTYSVGAIDLPNTEFQPCLLPKSNNTLGHCRHLAHCVIPEVISSFQDFVPYGEQCVIDARFVGICCPQKYIQKTESTTTEISSTTTSATTVV